MITEDQQTSLHKHSELFTHVKRFRQGELSVVKIDRGSSTHTFIVQLFSKKTKTGDGLRISHFILFFSIHNVNHDFLH
jgi:hypothetical protein